MSTNPYASIAAPICTSVYFSVVLATALYGITCMQAFFYYIHYRNDPLRLKILVAVIWILDTAQEALTIVGAYKYIMAGVINPLSFLDTIPEFALQAPFTAVVAILTQGFLMHRVYVFSGKKAIAVFVWLVLGIIEFVSVIIYTAKTLYISDGILRVVDITILNDKSTTATVTLCLCVAAGEDVLISIILILLLVRERSSILFSSTIHMIQRLTVVAVNTGMWTSTFALLSIIFMKAMPSKMTYLLFTIPICSVYSNTVLANVNARAYFREGSDVRQVNSDILKSTKPDSNEHYVEAKMIFAPSRAARRAGLAVSLDANTPSTISEEV